jgi:AcrR family transcriptional regulator
MSRRTLDPAAGPAPAGSPEGLRERKKRQMRRQLSDVATALFLERGFDAVRVAEVAAACGVSEKTVFNYFPVKEALIMDRLEITLAALRTGLADPAHTPVQAVLTILDRELEAMTGPLAGDENRRAVRRFGDLIRATPSLRAYQADMMDQSALVAAEVLAARTGLTADDPEPQIAARALLGLWRVQADSLRRHLDRAPAPAVLRELVSADVRRAACLIDSGLSTFAAPGLPPGRRTPGPARAARSAPATSAEAGRHRRRAAAGRRGGHDDGRADSRKLHRGNRLPGDRAQQR